MESENHRYYWRQCCGKLSSLANYSAADSKVNMVRTAQVPCYLNGRAERFVSQ